MQLNCQKKTLHTRTCPNCLEKIPIDSGFFFDDNLNLICSKCGKIAFLVKAILPHYSISEISE